MLVCLCLSMCVCICVSASMLVFVCLYSPACACCVVDHVVGGFRYFSRCSTTFNATRFSANCWPNFAAFFADRNRCIPCRVRASYSTMWRFLQILKMLVFWITHPICVYDVFRRRGEREWSRGSCLLLPTQTQICAKSRKSNCLAI